MLALLSADELMTIAQLTFAQHSRYAVADHFVVEGIDCDGKQLQESMERNKEIDGE